MNEFRKTFGRTTADALGGTVGREEFGMLFFEGAQTLDQIVVLAILNLRIVAHMVEFFVMANLFAQFGDRFFC